MTQQEVEELLPIITAFAEGKEIEYKYRNGLDIWTKVSDTSWRNDILEYRIKPEPRDYWIVKFKAFGGEYTKFHTFDYKPSIADLAVYGKTIKEVVHVKEVL